MQVQISCGCDVRFVDLLETFGHCSTVGSFLHVCIFVVHKNCRNVYRIGFCLYLIFGLVLVMFVVS